MYAEFYTFLTKFAYSGVSADVLGNLENTALLLRSCMYMHIEDFWIFCRYVQILQLLE